MSESVIGEIRMMAFPKPPDGWLLCDGSTYPVGAPYSDLFARIGTTFGGDGSTVFAVPDLRGRTPVHWSPQNMPLGQSAGTEGVTLNNLQLPNHTHGFICSTDNGTSDTPTQNQTFVAQFAGDLMYFNGVPGATQVEMSPSSLATAGQGLPHDNMMPSQVISFCIAYQGTTPPL